MISIKTGIEINPTNGQPSRTDIAVKKMANLSFWCHHAANAHIEKYIENELGNNAADEMNMPALNSWKTIQERPICTPNSRHIPLKKTINF